MSTNNRTLFATDRNKKRFTKNHKGTEHKMLTYQTRTLTCLGRAQSNVFNNYRDFNTQSKSSVHSSQQLWYLAERKKQQNASRRSVKTVVSTNRCTT